MQDVGVCACVHLCLFLCIYVQPVFVWLCVFVCVYGCVWEVCSGQCENVLYEIDSLLRSSWADQVDPGVNPSNPLQANHQCYTNATSMIHQRYIIMLQVNHQCYINATSMIHQCYINATLMLQLNHQCYNDAKTMITNATSCYRPIINARFN